MQNQAPTHLAACEPLIIHMLLQSVQGFGQAVCKQQLNNTPVAHLWWTMAIVLKPQVALFARGLCVIDDGYCQHSVM